MRYCPNCHREIPDDNQTIYCPYCNEIVDENVRLREQLEKTLKKENASPEKKVRSESKEEPAPRYIGKEGASDISFDDDEDSKKKIVIGVVCVVLVVAIAAFWYLSR